MTPGDDELYEALVDLESSAPTGPTPTLHVPSRSGAWLAAAATAAVLAALAYIGATTGILPGIGADGAPTPTITATSEPSPTPSPAFSLPSTPPPSAASATPTSSPTATPTANPPRFDIAWQSTEWPEDVTATAVAFDEEAGLWIAGGRRSIRTSSDTNTWVAADIQSPGCGAPEDACDWWVDGVERLGDQLVAVGLIGYSGSDTTALVAWLSTDGVNWALSTLPMRTTAQAPTTGQSGGTVLVATPDLTSPEGGTAFNTSEDGRTWLSSGEADGIKIHDVHGDADGFVGVGVAIGQDTDFASQPIIRRSEDGHAWSTVTLGVPGGDTLESVGRLPSGRLVAAGRAADGRVLVWASNAEGEAWTVTHLGSVGEVDQSRVGPQVQVGRSGAVVVANTNSGGLFVATSVDGETWRSTAAPPDTSRVSMDAVGSGADSIVVVGGTRDGIGGVAAPYDAWSGAIVKLAE